MREDVRLRVWEIGCDHGRTAGQIAKEGQIGLGQRGLVRAATARDVEGAPLTGHESWRLAAIVLIRKLGCIHRISLARSSLKALECIASLERYCLRCVQGVVMVLLLGQERLNYRWVVHRACWESLL